MSTLHLLVPKVRVRVYRVPGTRVGRGRRGMKNSRSTTPSGPSRSDRLPDQSSVCLYTGGGKLTGVYGNTVPTREVGQSHSPPLVLSVVPLSLFVVKVTRSDKAPTVVFLRVIVTPLCRS